TKAQRKKAVEKVTEINKEELLSFHKWLREAPLHKLLARQKIFIIKNTAGYLKNSMKIEDPEKINMVTNRVIRKLYHNPSSISSQKDIHQLIVRQAFFGVSPERTVYRMPKNSEI
ncbi:MAG: hypothetical protein HKO75_07855, partial [Flavobacteriaceae bacterium]|nr:hypothetical protein [Muriicola sp.]NNL39756.1 hypothetical protein [Flavobacteriaceae bacterium]